MFHVEYLFEAGATINNIIKAIHNPIERMKWDKDIEHAEVLDVYNEKILIWYQRNLS